MILPGENEKILLNYGIIQKALDLEASDIHLSPGNPPVGRVNGRLIPLEDLPYTVEEIQTLVRLLTNRFMLAEFLGENPRDLDYTLEIPPLDRRFRMNIFTQHFGPSIYMKVLSSKIRTVEELKLPARLNALAMERAGLILVTGPTGSGISTTISSMLETVNESAEKHIITLEDPIEIVFENKKSFIEQREVGTHVPDFQIALRNALRVAPDVLLVGEVSDEETAEMTLRAAQIGALVLATQHTRSARETIERFLTLFPDDHRGGVRLRIADCLRAVICQKLILTSDKKGRVPAVELLLGTSAIRHLIRQDKAHLLHSAMEIAAEDGMITMEQSLVRLGEAGLISWEDAFAHCNEKEIFLAGLPPQLRQQFTIDRETEMDIKQLEAVKASKNPITATDVYVGAGE